MNSISLQTRRNLDYFATRLGVADLVLDEAMSFSLPNHQLHLELRLGRLLLTTCMAARVDDERLQWLLQRSHPRHFCGYPGRVFRLRQGTAVNSVTADDASADLWWRLYRAQYHFLSQ
ncbi:hypothetical protein [Serratia quinivorans]|uniref:hypothetical protein n=1 Tax=Serratia quinivorans TaxID=137545 RepID=UPI00217A963A|nr:hypothetical protein [Serratia quinivorans]CAI1009255.1 type III secretion system protein SsaM [Serratia quinivorans]CAI1809809.1 type III secretion system protein SsaM [Serratia quinivorans]